MPIEYKLIKPPRLEKGDTVAIISPSWGGPSVFPKVYELGLKNLEEKFGLRIKEFPSARAPADFLYKNPKYRAKDINDAFADPEVKAIIPSIGGDDSIRILPYLDPKVIRKNPKILMGYSDSTTLLTYCNRLGLVTFHGPSIMAGFSQMGNFPEKFMQHVNSMLFETGPVDYFAYPRWTDGYKDWKKEENVGKVKKMQRNEEGWQWLQGSGKVRGQLFGGCIEIMDFLNGTDYWPKPGYWKNKVVFLETSEEKPSPQQVKYWLRNMGMQGIWDNANALVFGRARNYSSKEKKQLNENVVSIVVGEFGRKDLPIIANVDFGHTDPQLILPLGVKAEIDSAKKSFSILESGVR